MSTERFEKQLEFILEIDKLKQIYRQNLVTGTNRKENDAEHSWHLAMMAILLSEYASEQKIDVLYVIKMVLIHDLVEIDAGDTFAYDEKGYEDKEEREQKAADRLFNILPADQAEEMLKLWREFEAMETPEARFAASLDRFQPLLLNYNTDGHTWKKPGVSSEKVLKRIEPARTQAPQIWEYATNLIENAIDKGMLKR
jgi:putative hydrolase of HD superfamily